MSDKTTYEDKASAQEPRELSALKQTTTDLYKCVGKRDKSGALSLIDAIEREWKRANRLIIDLGAQGGHGDLIVSLSTALNDAARARGRALVLTSGIGSTRYDH